MSLQPTWLRSAIAAYAGNGAFAEITTMKPCPLHIALLLVCVAASASAQTPNTSTAQQVARDDVVPIAQSGPPSGNGSPHGGRMGRQRPPGPPPEAVAACSGKTSGATCNFVDRENRALSGTCMGPPAGAARMEGDAAPPLGCRPNRGASAPQGERDGPPRGAGQGCPGGSNNPGAPAGQGQGR